MDQYLTVKRLAQVLSVSESTARRLLKKGTLPSVRLGQRLVRVPEDQLRQVLGEHSTKGQEFKD